MADPAWTYDDKALAGDRGAGCKYKLMTIEDMKAMPVGDLAADDCVLLMWTTYPMLQEGLDLIKAWGFTYKTVAWTWIKPAAPFGRFLEAFKNPSMHAGDWMPLLNAVKTLWFIGMGRWTRSNAEIVMLATKGKPKRLDAGVNQIICAPAGRHSAKPPITRELIDRLLGKGIDKVELFAREEYPGWVGLGYDIDGQDLRDSIPALARVP